MPDPDAVLGLYLDADVDVKLAANLRAAGYNCVSAREVGNAALDDESQMKYAAGHERALLKHNIQHFVPIFERWWHAGKDHSGLSVSQQIPLGELQRRVIRLLNAVSPKEMKNGFRNLAEFSMRN